MANIYTPTKDEPTQDYTRMSRGVIPDRSTGIMLSGIGDLFGEALTGTDSVIKNEIKDQSYDQLSTLRDKETSKEISNLATPNPVLASASPANDTLLAPDNKVEVPSGINDTVSQAATELGKMRASKDAGKLNPLLYNLKASAIASDLRAKFPGYRDYVDASVSSVIGHNPANQALAEAQALNAANANRANAGTQAWVKHLRDNMEFLGPEGFAAGVAASSDPTKMMNIEMMIARRQESQQRQKEIKQGLEIQSSQNNLNGETALAAYDKYARNVFDDIWNPAVAAATGFTGKSLSEAVDKVRADADPRKIVAMGTVVDGLIRKYKERMLGLSSLPITQGGPSISGLVKDSSKLAKVDSQYLDLLETMKSSLVGKGNFNLLNASSQVLEATRSSDAVRLIYSGQAPGLRTMGGIGKLVPGTDVTRIYEATQNQKILGKELRAIQNIDLNKALTGEGNLWEFKEHADKVPPPAGKPDNKAEKTVMLKGILDVMKTALVSGTPEEKANAAKFFAHSENGEFIKAFNGNSQFDAWAAMSNPQVVEVMKKSPDFKSFTDWNRQTFKNLFANYAATVQHDGIELDPRYHLTYDPESMQLMYDLPKSLPGAASANSVRTAVDRLNVGLGIVKNMAEAAGQDPNVWVKDAMNNVGIDFQKAAKEKGSLSEWISNWIGNFNQPTPELFKKKSEGASDISSQNASVSPREGRTEGVQQPAVQLASLQQNAPEGSPGAPGGLLEWNVPVRGAGTVSLEGVSDRNIHTLTSSRPVNPKSTIMAVTDQAERVQNVKGYGKQLTGEITLNGNTYHFINGGGGRGSIPFGTYSVTNFRNADTREKQGLVNLGDTFDLSPKYDAYAEDTRRDLRIHRAHGKGTLGCIGIVGDEATFQRFVKDVKASGVKSLYLGPPPKSQTADGGDTEFSSQSRKLPPKYEPVSPEGSFSRTMENAANYLSGRSEQERVFYNQTRSGLGNSETLPEGAHPYGGLGRSLGERREEQSNESRIIDFEVPRRPEEDTDFSGQSRIPQYNNPSEDALLELSKMQRQASENIRLKDAAKNKGTTPKK